MKILMLTTKYPDGSESTYLTSELADAWQRLGHDVVVVVLKWDAKEPLKQRVHLFPSGVRAFYFRPNSLSNLGKLIDRLSRWGLSGYQVRGAARRAVGDAAYDLVFVFSPAVALSGLISEFVKGKSVRSHLYVTDFFPFAHRDIGLIPSGPIFAISSWLENYYMRMFDTISCMSPGNLAFMQKNYRLPVDQRRRVDYLWGEGIYRPQLSRGVSRHKFGLPSAAKLALFGGQLVEGRGVDEVIAAAECARIAKSDILFVIIGDGRLRPVVEQAAKENPKHLKWLSPIPRSDYLELAASCDVGLVVTVAHTNIPTFPSKTIDYLRVGLPVVAAVEESTDYSQFVRDHGFGVTINAGVPGALFEAIDQLSSNPTEMSRARDAGRATLKAVFDVDTVAKNMIMSPV